MSFWERIFGRKPETSKDFLQQFDQYSAQNNYYMAVSSMDKAIETIKSEHVRSNRPKSMGSSDISSAAEIVRVTNGELGLSGYPIYKGYLKYALNLSKSEEDNNQKILELVNIAEFRLIYYFMVYNFEFPEKFNDNRVYIATLPWNLAVREIINFGNINNEVEHEFTDSLRGLAAGIHNPKYLANGSHSFYSLRNF